jgi:superoxide dismutase, Cu-Zn family
VKMRRSIIATAFAAIAVVACALQDGPSTDTVAEVRAVIRDLSGRQVAIGSISEADGVRVRVEAAGMAAGTYGLHIHTVGRCEPPSFSSAGPHWNPTAQQHGSLNPLGAHLGDLPNLSVDAGGSGTVEFSIAGGSLRRGEEALIDGDGAALVIHAAPDDYRTDPSGNSGDRIACGVLEQAR